MKNLISSKIIFGLCLIALFIFSIIACNNDSTGSLGLGGSIAPSEKPIDVVDDNVVEELAKSEEFYNFKQYDEIISPLINKRMFKLKDNTDEMNSFLKEWALLLSTPYDRVKSDALGRKIGVVETKMAQFHSIVIEYQKSIKKMVTKYPNLNMKKEQVERLVDLYENTVRPKTESTNSIHTVCVTCPGMNCDECSGATIEGGDDPTNGGNDPGADYGGAGAGHCRNKAGYDHCVDVANTYHIIRLVGILGGWIMSEGTLTPAAIMAMNASTATLLYSIGECKRNFCD